MPLKERRTIAKKDEKDAGSRSWNALISLASFDVGFLALMRVFAAGFLASRASLIFPPPQSNCVASALSRPRPRVLALFPRNNCHVN